MCHDRLMSLLNSIHIYIYIKQAEIGVEIRVDDAGRELFQAIEEEGQDVQEEQQLEN